MYTVTKKHIKGILAGLTTTEHSNVQLEVGKTYTTFYGSSYTVVKIEKVD